MILESSRLILRDYVPSDWERVHIYGSVPEFSQFEVWGPNAVEDSKKFVNDMVAIASAQDCYQYNFAICLKSSNLLIGGCSIRKESQESRIANLGWAINPEFQNKGYCTEAAQRLIEFGFNELNLILIYATCDTRNAPSYRVMEKLKMKRVGLIKGERMQKGFMRDTFRYELLRE